MSVKLYENLTGETASPVAANPFNDTSDAEVLKAYNIGLTAGTAADTFSPNALLNREQAATMLARAIKASYIPGWTLAADGGYTLNFTQPAKFADDGKISEWAKGSVYYANANNIIAGTGSNMFSPADSATREQALAIAVRMVDNLKGKPIAYDGGTTQPPDTTQPPTTTEPPTTTQPPSGNNNYTNYWWRAGLPGFGFIQLYLNSNGEFTQEIRFNSSGGATHWEQIYKGNYNISGGTITFTYKAAEHRDAGKEWGTIALPQNKTLTFTYVEDDKIYGDYLDFTNGGLPPFDEPVTRLEEQQGDEDLFVTRFRTNSTNSSAFNR